MPHSEPIEVRISTSAREEMVDITGHVIRAINDSGVRDGACIVFVPHTTAGVTINENADPDVKRDFLLGMRRISPVREEYRHGEGNSDSHIKSSLVSPSLTIIVHRGSPLLGTWQGIYFCEFDGPRSRRFYIKVVPDR